jgi:hypothetical protein
MNFKKYYKCYSIINISAMLPQIYHRMMIDCQLMNLLNLSFATGKNVKLTGKLNAVETRNVAGLGIPILELIKLSLIRSKVWGRLFSKLFTKVVFKAG